MRLLRENIRGNLISECRALNTDVLKSDYTIRSSANYVGNNSLAIVTVVG